MWRAAPAVPLSSTTAPPMRSRPPSSAIVVAGNPVLVRPVVGVFMVAASTRPGAVLEDVAAVDGLTEDGVLELARLTIDDYDNGNGNGSGDVVAGVESVALELVAGAEGTEGADSEWLVTGEEAGAGEVGAGEVGAGEVGGGERGLDEPGGEDTGGEDVPDEAGGVVYGASEDGAGEYGDAGY